GRLQHLEPVGNIPRHIVGPAVQAGDARRRAMDGRQRSRERDLPNRSPIERPFSQKNFFLEKADLQEIEIVVRNRGVSNPQVRFAAEERLLDLPWHPLENEKAIPRKVRLDERTEKVNCKGLERREFQVPPLLEGPL